ncbi:MAG: putative membrane protein, partial [Arenicella sp.]
NRVLIGLAVMSLLFYISSYYYLLEISLLDKSLTLLVLGLVLILGRWLMLKLLEISKDSAGSRQ